MNDMKFVYNKFSGVGEQRVLPYPTLKSASGRKTFSVGTQKIFPPDVAILPSGRSQGRFGNKLTNDMDDCF